MKGLSSPGGFVLLLSPPLSLHSLHSLPLAGFLLLPDLLGEHLSGTPLHEAKIQWGWEMKKETR